MLKRSPRRKSDPTARASGPVFKPRPCKVCKTKFTPTRGFVSWCGPECGFELASELARKKAEKAAKADRRETRAKLEKLKTRGDWIQEAEYEVRRFRRLEELAKGRGCMSCRRSQEEVQGTDGWKPGGAWDAGHFLGKGARPELRMEPLCIWLQCKSCNAGSAKYARKGYTVGLAFEENLRAQEGDALVDWLKGPHEPKHYTIDDLKEIKRTYKAKAKALAG